MATVTKGKTFANGELVTPEKLHQMVDAATVTAIATADISNNAITTAKIADSNVTTAKLADSAITSAKIADGTIVNADISASAAIALSKLATGALPTAITVASANIVDGTIVNADISATAAIADTKLATISTSGKVSNSATTATSANTANAIVARDASGNFSAGTITANLTGTASGNALSSHTHAAADITSGTLANARTTATSANTFNAIVTRDGGGNFSAGVITAALSGNASTATTLQTARTINGVSFNGSSNITVTAAPNAHTHSASDITSGTLANARTTATNANTANAIVARDASGNFSAGTITANLTGTASGNAPATGIAPSAITGTAVITTDSRLSDARTPTAHNHDASAINAGILANARTSATSANTVNAIVARDASGNFSAGTITANLTGTASGNAPATGIAPSAITGTAVITTDSRLSDARTPTSHTHGNITNAGAIGATANLPLITTTSGVVTTGSFGSTANTFCQGNDSRLSDARTPTAHNHDASAINSGTLALARIPTGTTAATVCIGNDSRLSDARTPTSHTHSAADITSGTLANARTTATSANTANAIVARDASGNFSAGTITASSINNIPISRGGGNNQNNTALGSSSLSSNTSGTRNTALGLAALQDNLTGTNNTAVGVDSGLNIKAGNGNTAVGSDAMYNIDGSNNTIIGYRSAYAATGFYNNVTCLGFQSEPNASNQITLGNSSVSSLRCQVQTISSLSDRRDKKDITDIPAGLDFVKTLKPRLFVWDMRDGGKVDISEFGFIAQEIQECQNSTGITVPNFLDENDPEKLGVSYGTLIPVLVKAVQELAARVEALEAK